MRDRPHSEVMIENYRADPAFAAAMLNAVLEDGDADELQELLQLMNVAFGDGSGQCRGAGDMLATIRAMGLRLSATPISTKPPRRRAKAAKSTTPKRAAHVRRTVVKSSAVPV